MHTRSAASTAQCSLAPAPQHSVALRQAGAGTHLCHPLDQLRPGSRHLGLELLGDRHRCAHAKCQGQGQGCASLDSSGRGAAARWRRPWGAGSAAGHVQPSTALYPCSCLPARLPAPTSARPPPKCAALDPRQPSAPPGNPGRWTGRGGAGRRAGRLTLDVLPAGSLEHKRPLPHHIQQPPHRVLQAPRQLRKEAAGSRGHGVRGGVESGREAGCGMRWRAGGRRAEAVPAAQRAGMPQGSWPVGQHEQSGAPPRRPASRPAPLPGLPTLAAPPPRLLPASPARATR